MPYPGVPDKYTKKMESCVSQIMAREPGMEKGRAIAICKSRIVPGRSAGDELSRPVLTPIRRIDGGEGSRYRAYAVRFNGPEDKDLYNTYFDSGTEYMLDYYRTRPWLYDHGLHPAVGLRKVGDWDVIDSDDQGVFVEGELDSHHEFREGIETLIDEGVLYPSSGTLSYLARIADDGHVEQWPIAEVTSTVRPGDWRMLDSISPAARSAMRMLLEEEVQTMEVSNVNLKELKDLLGLGAADADTTRSDDPDPEPDVNEAGEDEDEGETETKDEELETARAIIEHVNEQFSTIRKAIEGLDTVVHTMGDTVEAQQALLEGLAQDEMTRTRAAVAGTEWYRNLHVASREGPETSKEENDKAGTSGGGDDDATGWERISGQA